ncbi:hypothetical protein HI914_05849 [Erysiphe necator]|nr:hypothetical protein HI914_05849 [Erysiphe necator]
MKIKQVVFLMKRIYNFLRNGQNGVIEIIILMQFVIEGNVGWSRERHSINLILQAYLRLEAFAVQEID